MPGCYVLHGFLMLMHGCPTLMLVLMLLQRTLGIEKGERMFATLSLEERSKFDTETFSNVGGMTRRESLPAAGGYLNGCM